MIEQRGYTHTFWLPLEGSIDIYQRFLDGMIEVARILSLTEVCTYFMNLVTYGEREKESEGISSCKYVG